jgi:membrane-associated phospholipid phosphatase
MSWVVVGTVLAAPLAISARATVEQRASASALGESVLSLALPYSSVVLLGLAAKYAFARERPFATRAGLARRCGRDRGDSAECEWDRNGSFFSLHAALAFAGAGTTCAHALRFAPDHATLDASSCGLATLGATVGALLRMTADKHYATDVITGALVGLALSVGLGWGLHLSDRAPLALAEELASPTPPMLGPRGDALAVTLGGAAGVIGGVLVVTAFSRQLQ